jgi:GT2 family glycosyltransferase
LLRIFIARVILYFDLRYRFINVDYIETMRGVSNSRKSTPSISQLSKNKVIAPKTLTAREYYALVLLWSGIPPHPKFRSIKKLPTTYSLKIRVSYQLLRLGLGFLAKFNPSVQSVQNLGGNNTVWANSLSLEFASHASPKVASPQVHENLTIVIPVFNAFEYLTQCLDSVFSTTKSEDILVIDDASTDPRIAPYLAKLKADGKIRLISNSRNLGFVKSANLGLSSSDVNDIILLNSDTIVFDGWLDGILETAKTNLRVATVTAMSNASTVYSLPFEEEFNCSPEITAIMAQELMSTSKSQRIPIEIPTCHGFCVLITRQALIEIGLFDEDTFGLGYGEENDFSMRAKIAGFKDLLATTVVVHHFGSKSFEKSRSTLSRKNMQELLARYPGFLIEVDNFVTQKKLSQLRLRAFRAIHNSGILPITVHVTHSLGGGVSKSIDLETREMDSILLTIEPLGHYSVSLKFSYQGLKGNMSLEALPFENIFSSLFKYLGIDAITIQHLLGYSSELTNSLLDTETLKTLRLHDYYYLCPRIHLVGTNNIDCKLPDNGSCNKCLSSDTDFDIETYRLSKAPILRSASLVTAPSLDTSNRYKSIYQGIEIEKESFDSLGTKILLSEKLNHTDAIVVGILGELSPHKGFDLLLNLATIDTEEKFRFEVFGALASGLSMNRSNVHVHGKYKNFRELTERITAIKPDVFLFPGRIPETYSYTLTEALRFGVPIAYFQTGAIAERLADHKDGIPLSLDATSLDVLSSITTYFASRNAKR